MAARRNDNKEFSEYRELILAELKRLSGHLDKIEEKVDTLQGEITEIKVSSDQLDKIEKKVDALQMEVTELKVSDAREKTKLKIIWTAAGLLGGGVLTFILSLIFGK